MMEEVQKTRKPRADKGTKRGPRIVMREVPSQDLPPVLVIVDGEPIRCNSWSFEGGFLKLSYWPEQRGRVGTRYIAVSTIKDLKVEQPMELPYPTLRTAVPDNLTTNTVEGPQSYINPVIAAKQRDPKAFQAEAVKDPMGVRPMSRILDEEGRVAVVEAGIS